MGAGKNATAHLIQHFNFKNKVKNLNPNVLDIKNTLTDLESIQSS